MRYDTPIDLIAALRGSGHREASQELSCLCADGLSSFLKLRGLQNNSRVHEHTLRWAEMYVRTRPQDEWNAFSQDAETAWEEFRNYVIGAAIRLLLWPSSSPTDSLPDPDSPGEVGYERGEETRFCWKFNDLAPPAIVGVHGPGNLEARIFQKPKHKHSGDLVEICFDEQGVWLLVADGCGKGHAVYLVVQGVACLWHSIPGRAKLDPVSFMSRLQKLLTPHMPDGFFLEAALVHVSPPGRVTIAAAGGSKLLVRKSPNSTVELQTLSGRLLGDVPYPESVSFEEYQRTCNSGEEMLISTDGLFDQQLDGSSLQETISELLADSASWSSVYEQVTETLNACLGEAKTQTDDISFAAFRGL